MPVSSTPSRVALAPLNTNVNTDSPVLKTRSFNGSSLPLTPSLTPKFSLTKSATSIVPNKTSYTSARKFDSFSDYKISNNRNVKADLAATKLKLRLQLAFYKLKVQKRASHAASPNIRVSGQFKSRVGKQPVSRLGSRLGSNPNFPGSRLDTSSPKTNSPKTSSPKTSSPKTSSPKTSSPRTKSALGTDSTPGTTDNVGNVGNFSTGANVNLQKPRSVSNPRLSTVAAKKPTLKLYHIKPSSAFHNMSPRLPLYPENCTQGQMLSQTAGQSSQNIGQSSQNTSHILVQSSQNTSQILGQGNQNTSYILGQSFGNRQILGHLGPEKVPERLPPVHRILKTPIKASSKMTVVSASDETIDETADDSTLEVKKRDDFLGSSPLRNNFGTPNSFSVAKSLLQLGSGFY